MNLKFSVESLNRNDLANYPLYFLQGEITFLVKGVNYGEKLESILYFANELFTAVSAGLLFTDSTGVSKVVYSECGREIYLKFNIRDGLVFLYEKDEEGIFNDAEVELDVFLTCVGGFVSNAWNYAFQEDIDFYPQNKDQLRSCPHGIVFLRFLNQRGK